jgi:hypothetical protein
MRFDLPRICIDLNVRDELLVREIREFGEVGQFFVWRLGYPNRASHPNAVVTFPWLMFAFSMTGTEIIGRAGIGTDESEEMTFWRIGRIAGRATSR